VDAANFSHEFKDAQENFTPFDAHDIPSAGREKKSAREAALKFDFTWV